MVMHKAQGTQLVTPVYDNNRLTGVVGQLVVCQPNDVGAYAIEEVLRKEQHAVPQ